MTTTESTDGADRGQSAASPTQIPARGWKDILKRAWTGITTKNLGIVSAGVAFYSLLAIFPALAALVSIYGLIADPSDVQSLIDLSGQVHAGRRQQADRRPDGGADREAQRTGPYLRRR